MSSSERHPATSNHTSFLRRISSDQPPLSSDPDVSMQTHRNALDDALTHKGELLGKQSEPNPTETLTPEEIARRRAKESLSKLATLKKKSTP